MPDAIILQRDLVGSSNPGYMCGVFASHIIIIYTYHVHLISFSTTKQSNANFKNKFPNAAAPMEQVLQPVVEGSHSDLMVNY